jgi:hypothetical protein
VGVIGIGGHGAFGGLTHRCGVAAGPVHTPVNETDGTTEERARTHLTAAGQGAGHISRLSRGQPAQCILHDARGALGSQRLAHTMAHQAPRHAGHPHGQRRVQDLSDVDSVAVPLSDL